MYNHLLFHDSCFSINSVDIWVSLLDKSLAFVELFVFITLLLWGLEENATSGSLGFASLSNLSSASHINIGDTFLFAKNGQVTQHING
eukprot:403371880